MLAGKIDIGSMGDYPLLINGSRAGTGDDGDLDGRRHRLQPARRPQRRRGRRGLDVAGRSPTSSGGDISASVGSAGHGTLVQALEKAGHRPRRPTSRSRTRTRRSAPPPCRAARSTRSRSSWPGRACWCSATTPGCVYDGGRARAADPARHRGPQRVRRRARRRGAGVPRGPDRRHRLPARAPASRPREIVAEATGLPPEVVYLYNGRNGVSTFDTTHQAEQVAALEHDVPFLKSIGVLEDPLDLDAFVDDSLIKRGLRRRLRRRRRLDRQPAAITGTDEVCGTAGHRPGARRRGLGRRRGRHPPGRRPDLPAAHRERRPRPTAARCGRRTCRTRSPAPAGSPTR